MTIAIFLVAKWLVFSAALILARALFTVKQLNAQLPPGPLRKRWYAMTAMIVQFIVGYLVYIAAFWNSHQTLLDLLVPGIFFFGACFVWLSAKLSLQTAIDVMRISVLEKQAHTDPLTGAYNRRYMEQRLADHISVAQRYHQPLSVILMDIDHFKQINDGDGHQLGDQVLVGVLKLVAGELRELDFVARLGGDEFLVITPHTAPSAAAGLAERLRRKIESFGFESNGKSGLVTPKRVTVSAGVASLGPGICSSGDLIAAADKQLYSAKHAGRNRVAVSDGNGQADGNAAISADAMNG